MPVYAAHGIPRRRPGRANGDHAGAAAHLRTLIETAGDFEDLAGEHRGLICHARILIARGLCDDDMYADSVPVWTEVLGLLDEYARRGDVESDHLFVHGALSYGRFCVETGRLDEAQPWLRRAEARAGAREWRLAGARAQLERAAARWADGDIAETQTLVHQAYPAIAEHVRAHDVAQLVVLRAHSVPGGRAGRGRRMLGTRGTPLAGD